MSDGQRSGRSTGRVSCKSTELKRCSAIEMRWNKYEVSLMKYLTIIIIVIFLLSVVYNPEGWQKLDRLQNTVFATILW